MRFFGVHALLQIDHRLLAYHEQSLMGSVQISDQVKDARKTQHHSQHGRRPPRHRQTRLITHGRHTQKGETQKPDSDADRYPAAPSDQSALGVQVDYFV